MGNLKIAITGSNGFLGSHLVNFLVKNKKDFFVFDQKKHSFFEIASLEDFVKNKDIVFHLAGANRDTDFNLFKINALGTMGLLEAMVKFGKKGAKIVFASSFQVYRPTSDERLLNETSMVEPSSVYGISKLVAEGLIQNYCLNKNLKGVILRFSNLYGLGGKPFYNSVISTFLQFVKNDQALIINGSGEQKRDFLSVEDAVLAMQKTIDYNPQNCEIFNICSGKLFSLNQVVGIIKEVVVDRKIKVDYNKNAEEHPLFLKGDFQKAKKILSWAPKTDFKNEIKKIYED